MKNIGRIVTLVLGCLIVALSYNIFVIPNNLLSFGENGFAALLSYCNGVTPALNVLFINIILLLLASVWLDKNTIKSYFWPAILIPFFMFLTRNFNDIVNIQLSEMLLAVLTAGVLSGIGYSFIYKEGFSGGIFFLVEELIGKLVHFHSKMYSWVIDIIMLILAVPVLGYQLCLYSLIIIIISRYMITKARFGISDSKMFFIITSREKEVKNFIMHDLKYELTVLDVKGGFTKRQNQIIMTVISTNDYYQLKEGIKIIDPKAFIAITDTYDVVNRSSF